VSTLSGRNVVVFGGSGALGAGLVERLAADGATVVSADVALPSDERRKDGVEYRTLDVLSDEGVTSLLDGVEGDLWGAVNVVGGYDAGGPLAALDLGTLRSQLELNLLTAAHLTKQVLSRLIRQDAGGRLVHTSSRAAVGDGKNSFPYSVSKLGVVRLVEAAAAEVRDRGITVNCLLPSVIDTPANRAAMPSSDHSRWPKPSELAGVVAFLLSDDAALVSGAAIPVYGRA
jgi:NAD(P)-dependent dehydrogenase (short-subunit alcohol dehydrogenase family)